jgi:hypothetical protein
MCELGTFAAQHRLAAGDRMADDAGAVEAVLAHGQPVDTFGVAGDAEIGESGDFSPCSGVLTACPCAEALRPSYSAGHHAADVQGSPSVSRRAIAQTAWRWQIVVAELTRRSDRKSIGDGRVRKTGDVVVRLCDRGCGVRGLCARQPVE